MQDEVVFEDRSEAGRLLANRLAAHHLKQPVVLALPRGGVPVAAEIAIALRAPIELVFVRKIGLPRNPEFAAAAVVDGGTPEIVLNDEVVEKGRVSDAFIEAEAETELREIERRRAAYVSKREPIDFEGRDLIVVDDGIATGTSMRAALAALRRKRPHRIVLALPVAPAEVIDKLQRLVDEIVCLAMPLDFMAVGSFYRDFHQLEDAEVTASLDRVATAAKAAILP